MEKMISKRRGLFRKRIKLSIIIPVYNVEEYITDCLDSILSTSYKEMEVILVDDCSPDSSFTIIEHYQQLYNNIRIVKHNSNKGLSAARNSGLKVAEGRYIWFIDSDDMIESNAITNIMHRLDKTDLDILFFGYSEILDNKKTVIKTYKSNAIVSGMEYFCNRIDSGSLTVPSWCQVYSKSFLIDNNITFKEGIIHEDNLFVFRVLMKAQKVYHLDESYYIYRKRENSIMSIKNEKEYFSFFVILLDIISFWNLNNFSVKENTAILKYIKYIYSVWNQRRAKIDLSKEVQCGSEIEKEIYNLLLREGANLYDSFSKELLSELSKHKVIYMFGAGNIACELCNALLHCGIFLDYILVSDVNEHPDSMFGIPIVCANYENLNHSACVIMAVSSSRYEEVKDYLLKIGYTNVITING